MGKRIRLAHISDLHIRDERADEIAMLLEFAGNEIEKAGVDLILDTGDVFDAASSETERLIFARACAQYSHIAPHVIVKGNHDKPNELTLFGQVDNPWTENGAGFTRKSGRYPIVVCEDTRPVQLGDSAVVFPIPWFTKAHIAAALPPDAGAGEIGERLKSAAASMIRGISGLIAATDRVPIIGAHVLIGGSVVSSGQTLIGTTVEVSPHDLNETRAGYIGLGHIHNGEANIWYDGRVCYAGSLYRHDFGEPERKGIRIVELERTNGYTRLVSSEFIELPARRIEFIDIDLTDKSTRQAYLLDPLSVLQPHLGSVGDALTRVRYTINTDDRDGINEADINRIVTNAGAHSVKIEPVVQQNVKTRAPEIIIQTAIEDKLGTWLDSQGMKIRGDDRILLDAALAEIEIQESAALDVGLGGIHLSKVSFRGLTRFTDAEPVTLDFEAMGPGLIAYVGETGAGKSSAMEATPVALGYGFPTRSGSLYSRCHGKDAFSQAVITTEAGDTLDCRVLIDAANEATEGYLSMNGKPLVSGKITEYKSAVAAMLGSPALFTAGPFATQDKSGSLLAMKAPAEKRALFIEMLPSLKRLEAISQAAKVKRVEAETKLRSLQDKLSGLLPLIEQAGETRNLLNAAESLLATYQSRVETAQRAEQEATDKLARIRKEVAHLATLREAVTSANNLAQAADRALSLAKRDLEDTTSTLESQLNRETERAASLSADTIKARHARERARFEERERQFKGILAGYEQVEAAEEKLPGLQKELAALKSQRDQRVALERSLSRAQSGLQDAENRLSLAEQLHAQELAENNRRAALITTASCATTENQRRQGWLEVGKGVENPIKLADVCPMVMDARQAETKAAALKLKTFNAENKTVEAARTEVSALQTSLSKIAVTTADIEAAESALSQCRLVAAKRDALNQAESDLEDLTSEIALWGSNASGELDRLADEIRTAGEVIERLRTEKTATLDAKRSAVTQAETELATAREHVANARAVFTDAQAACPDEKDAVNTLDSATRERKRIDELIRTSGTNIGSLRGKLELIEDAEGKTATLRAELVTVTGAVERWTLLERAFGKEGIQALELDAAGPEVARRANDLMSACFGPRFSIGFETLRAQKSKKNAFTEVFDIKVFDWGVERVASDLSGGEKALVSEALGLAVAGFNNSQGSGVKWRTLWRDETSGALDPKTADQYVLMLRRALKEGSFYQIHFVAHSPAVYNAADVQLYVHDGRIDIGLPVAA